MKNILSLCCLVVLLTGCLRSTKSSMNVATFNIRYDNPSDNPNHWNARKERVADYILSNQIDIVGMQEVLHIQFEDLKQLLPAYSAVGVGREDGKQQGEYAPIFYQRDRFKLIDSGTFWLSQYPDSIGFIGWDGACTRIATWAKLKEKSSSKVFMVVNTHFDHVGVEARKNSALLIIDRIQKISGNNPAILTGDFNISDQWDAYQTITTHKFILRDARKVAEIRSGVDYSFHDFDRLAEDKREIIDFIFVTPQISVLKSIIPSENIYPEGLMSDHNPQLSQISF